MAGKWIVGVVAVATAAVLAAGAGAAGRMSGPDASRMTLQPEDFPGSHATGQRVDTGATGSGYERVIHFATPYGASKYKAVASIALAAPDTATADQAYRILAHRYSTKAYRLALLKELVPIPKSVIAKVGSEKLIKPRPLGIHDSSMEIGFLVDLGFSKLNVSVSLLRVENAIVLDVATGNGKLVALADSQAFATLAAAHISTALVPTGIAPPTVGGTASQGETLTATTGTWEGSTTSFAYQWQRCDAAGANCADIAGATAVTYVVTPADAGATLRVNVTATGRFGSATAPSAVTAVVT
jgi:hypothetical protein